MALLETMKNRLAFRARHIKPQGARAGSHGQDFQVPAGPVFIQPIARATDFARPNPGRIRHINLAAAIEQQLANGCHNIGIAQARAF